MGRHQGATGSLVAPVGSAATRSDQAQLLGGLVKEGVGVERPDASEAVTDPAQRLVARSAGKVYMGIDDVCAGLVGGAAGGANWDVAV